MGRACTPHSTAAHGTLIACHTLRDLGAPYVHRRVNQLRCTESDETSAKLFSYFGDDGLKRFRISVQCAGGLF